MDCEAGIMLAEGGLRTCYHSTNSRLSHYKKNNLATWKDEYRKRCLERLRQQRWEVICKHRGVLQVNCDDDISQLDGSDVRQVMSHTLADLQMDVDNSQMDFFYSPAVVEIISTLDLMEEIQAEMRAEEAKMMAEYDVYEASLQLEEAALSSAIEMLHTSPMCPVCTKNPLMEKKGVIFCRCGLRVNTEDNLSLDYVQQQLDKACDSHNCGGQPVFTVQQRCGFSNLFMLCKVDEMNPANSDIGATTRTYC